MSEYVLGSMLSLAHCIILLKSHSNPMRQAEILTFCSHKPSFMKSSIILLPVIGH